MSLIKNRKLKTIINKIRDLIYKYFESDLVLEIFIALEGCVLDLEDDRSVHNG